MSKFPCLVNEVYQTYVDRHNAEPPFRPHLGGSLIGHECERHAFNVFHWIEKPDFKPNILKLFERGQNEEHTIVRDIRATGKTVWEVDNNGNQFRVSAVAGHFSGSLDGVVDRLTESNKPHLLEFKTHNDKSFKELEKKGVKEAKPLHYAQMQVYMYLSGKCFGEALALNRAAYYSVNKNDDRIYVERVRLDEDFAASLVAKAERVIKNKIVEAQNLAKASSLPFKIAEDPSWYKCKMCDFSAQCHGQKAPFPSCRSCVFSKPSMEGDQQWTCTKFNQSISFEKQLKGCDYHLYEPRLLAHFADVVDGDSESITYINRKCNDYRFTNGNRDNGKSHFLSREIYAVENHEVLTDGDDHLNMLRSELSGELVG